MTLEDAAVRAMVPVVGALCFLFKLLWSRSDECEKDRRELRKDFEDLLRQYGDSQGALGKAQGELEASERELEIYERCSIPYCPMKRGIVAGAIIIAFILLTSCQARIPQQPTVVAIQEGKKFVTVVIPPPMPTNILTSIFGDSIVSSLSKLFGL